jgi:hypothetical protein
MEEGLMEEGLLSDEGLLRVRRHAPPPTQYVEAVFIVQGKQRFVPVSQGLVVSWFSYVDYYLVMHIFPLGSTFGGPRLRHRHCSYVPAFESQ